jgi:hypothetical protein
MTVLELFAAIEASSIGTALRDSYWLFPAVEAVHLLGLCVIGGAVLLVDMRMLGFGLTRTPLSELAAGVRPYLRWSVLVMLLTGYALFASEATKCYDHDAFWVKMTCLFLAILFTWTVKAKVVSQPDGSSSPGTLKAVAIVSLLLWTGVGIGGRWIGFS